jgi:hypothetical protein
VPGEAVSRVNKGDWLEDGKWITLAQADALHAAVATPWQIETDNFILKSTASRQQAIQVAERLETIRQFCFRQYLEFFMRGSTKQGAQLLFNQTAPKKMLVYFFGTKEDYEAVVKRDFPGKEKELGRMVGFYSPAKHNSYFYQMEGARASLSIQVMQHEVTHQILGEYVHTGAPPVWAVEGVARVLECARPAGDRPLVLPTGCYHPAVYHAALMLKDDTLPSIVKIMQKDHEAFHDEKTESDNYGVSGAFCRFLLEMQNGAYAADFLEYLYDAYRNPHPSALSDYLAMDNTELEAAFRIYLKTELEKVPVRK